jgi:nitroimidazol reductase NimA-like FMN-containing flavoprotein (pyridoxamine 5'-phosphate oxidase superfamily)
MTTGIISPLYGDASATAPPWSDIDQRLTDAQLYWLVTVRRDGRPHAVPLCRLWHEGAFFFCTGEAEQKMRNLEANPQVAVTAGPLGADGWARGKDIVVEGTAVAVTEDELLETLTDGWRTKYAGDWDFEVREHRFFEVTDRGDGAGDGAVVFRVAPRKVLVFGDDHGQTTYRL